MKVVIILLVVLALAVLASSLDYSYSNDIQLGTARDATGNSDRIVKQEGKKRKDDEKVNKRQNPTDCKAVTTAFIRYERATNWMKMCKKVKNWDKIIRNKAAKKDIFIAGAEALMRATNNGTSCGEKAANTTINAAMDTLTHRFSLGRCNCGVVSHSCVEC